VSAEGRVTFETLGIWLEISAHVERNFQRAAYILAERCSSDEAELLAEFGFEIFARDGGSEIEPPDEFYEGVNGANSLGKLGVSWTVTEAPLIMPALRQRNMTDQAICETLLFRLEWCLRESMFGRPVAIRVSYRTESGRQGVYGLSI